MPSKPIDPKSWKPVPLAYSGKWIAWNAEHSEIVAHADNMPALWRIVRDSNIPDPIFEKVPRSDLRFVGMR